MRDYIFPKLRSTITRKEFFSFPFVSIKDDEHIEVKTNNYVLKCCLKQFVSSDIDFENLKKYMEARYELFSFVDIYKDRLQKEPISNFHVNKKFISVLFYSVSVSYEKFLPKTILDESRRELSLNESSKDYILYGNISSIQLTVTAFYELSVTPAKLPVPHVAEGVGGRAKRKLL